MKTLSAKLEANDVMKNTSVYLRATLLALAFQFALCAVSPQAQVYAQDDFEVDGDVTDAESGNGLPGVNVVVKGAPEIGTITRTNGAYSIEVPSPTDTLVFSFVGYQSQEVPIDDRSEVDVALEASVMQMEEVVVSVGYGEQSITTTTGSVSQISGEDLEVEPTTNLSNALQGRVPGLIGVNSSGRPGSDGSNLIIRGAATLNNNAPLVVIDGIPGRQGGLNRLNPSDIKNISVLKDASAAIYGSRAANGVILVETKRGQAGETRINVNVEQGFSQPTIVPQMADAATYMTMLNEIDEYNDNPHRYTPEEIEAHRGDVSGSWERFNTDWYNTALKDYSYETVANASVSGGSEDVRYFVSARGVTENGILVNSNTDYNQFGFRSNVDGDISPALTLSMNLHGRLEQRNRPSWTRGVESAWEMLQRGKPTEPAYWPNGQPGPAQEEGVNPVVAGLTGYDDSNNYYFQSNLSLEAQVPGVEGWTLEGTAAYDKAFYERKRWQEPWTLYNWGGERDEDGNPVLIPTQTGVPEPRLSQWNSDTRDVLLRATSRYERSFGPHNTSFLLGSEWQSSKYDYLYAFRRYFPTDQIQELFAGGQAQRANDGTGSQSARLNFFGRANYNYKAKYLLEFVARYDGSYIFPEDDRFGFFPSVSAGWQLAQERWFNVVTASTFDRFKLRASYGQTGNDQIEPFQYLRTYGFGGEFAYGDGLGTRISATRVPNPDITWEVANQFDVGIQGGLLNERLTFDMTYFRQLREDILWFRSEAVPETAGFSLPRENIGEVLSYGFEGMVGFVHSFNDDVSLRAGANITYAENEIRYFAEAEGVLPWQQNTGMPMNTGLYYVADGIWKNQEQIDNAEAVWDGARPGDIRFADLNDDGTIDGDDRKRVAENSRPDVIGGVTLGATLGPVDAHMFWQGATQVQQYVFSGAVGEFGNYFQSFAENRWTSENPDASGPRAYNRVEPYWASNSSTYFLRDAKYLRLKSARIAYTLPQNLTTPLSVEGLQLYVSGRNLITFTPLEIMDPEIRVGSAQTYPPERAYVLGLQMNF